MKRDFLSFNDVTPAELKKLVARAGVFKKQVKAGKSPKLLNGKVLGLIFEKSSTRTRVSFEVAMHRLGGYAIYLNQDMSQLGRGESYADTARVLSRYLDVIVLRTYSQHSLEELAKYAGIPVINGLTDEHHPCQLVADLLTLSENGKDLRKCSVAYVGDGNNMAHSWMQAARLLGFDLRIASPKGYEVADFAKKEASRCKNILLTNDPKKAAAGADAVNADTWFSMGQKVSAAKRKAFAPFQLNAVLMDLAKKDALAMHCLPAHRGEEITDDVMDGPNSVVFDEAENRLYAHMAILELLVK
jgi:ornithine carbamoyltransferase